MSARHQPSARLLWNLRFPSRLVTADGLTPLKATTGMPSPARPPPPRPSRRLREELNPDQQFGSTIALPPGASIKADLAAPRWELTPRGIKVEDKNEIRKRLGRSPDDGDAIVMCLAEGAKAAMRQLSAQDRERRPERAEVGYADFKRRFCGSPAERPGGAG
jgi:hypothetical protein